MRIASILSLFVTASISVTAFAEKKSLKEYWAETGFSLQSIEDKRIITRENCSKSTASMVGCLHAVNVLGEVTSPKLTVVTTSYLVGPYKGDFGPVVKTIGPFSIVQAIQVSPPKNSSMRSIYELLERKRAAQIESVSALVKSGQSKDIEEVYAYMKSQAMPLIIKNNLGGLAAATMYNSHIVQAEDAHARLLPIAKLQEDGKDASIELIGIGAGLKKLFDDSIVIEHINPGTPAQMGNLMPGDVVTAIDGISIKGLSLDQVVDKVRGKENTLVRLQLNRNEKVFEISLKRTRVVIPNLEYGLDTLDTGTKVGYIRLRSFSEFEICKKISHAITDLTMKGASGFVFDLRDNGGGFLDQSTCISSLFVGKKLIVSERQIPTGFEKQHYGDGAKITNLPMVVLINGSSASASEIVAGALQDYSRAWIVGERSYGKGTVQTPKRFSSTIYQYRTTERFHQPSGRTNQLHGILPDIEVPEKPGMSEDDRFVLREKERYQNALGAIGKPWVQTRPAEVARLQECIARTGTAEKVYAERSDEQIPPEYQVLKAQDAIRCLAN